MSLNQDNTDEVYSVESGYVKSSYGDKRFILKSKMQKIQATKIFSKTILEGTQQLNLTQITQKKYVLLKIWQRFLRGQDNYLQPKNLENVCGLKLLVIAILAGTKQLYLRLVNILGNIIQWTRVDCGWQNLLKLWQICNVFVFTCTNYLFKRRDALHIGC